MPQLLLADAILFKQSKKPKNLNYLERVKSSWSSCELWSTVKLVKLDKLDTMPRLNCRVPNMIIVSMILMWRDPEAG